MFDDDPGQMQVTGSASVGARLVTTSRFSGSQPRRPVLNQNAADHIFDVARFGRGCLHATASKHGIFHFGTVVRISLASSSKLGAMTASTNCLARPFFRVAFSGRFRATFEPKAPSDHQPKPYQRPWQDRHQRRNRRLVCLITATAGSVNS